MSRTPRHTPYIGVALRMFALLAAVVVSVNAVPLESPAVADHPYDYARHPWSIHSSSRNEDYCVDASASSMAEVTARAKIRRTLFEDQPTKDWHQPNDEDRIYFYEHTTPCLDMSSATRDTMELQYRIMDDTGSCLPDSCLYSRTNAWPDQLHSDETQSQFASGDWKNIVIRMKTTHVNGTIYLLHHAVNHETGHFLGLCDPDACGDTGACLVSVMHSYHGCTEREWPQAADRAQVVLEAADGSSGQTRPHRTTPQAASLCRRIPSAGVGS